ncbi:hypothetical protein ACFWE2_04825, partial [Promicromonospora sp. NPDC060271]
MTRSGEMPSRTADGPDPSRPFGGMAAGTTAGTTAGLAAGMTAGPTAGVGGVVAADAAGVRALRELLARMILPGGTDTASSVSRQTQAEWVDLLGELEAVKNTVTATQARLAVALEEATKADEAR